MLFSNVIYAFEVRQKVSLAEKYESNVFLTENDEESAFSSSIKYEFQSKNETRKLSFELDTALGYRYFSDNNIGSEYFGKGSISSVYKFDESNRFKWVTKDSLRQDQIDSDSAFIPDNLRYENYFLTGPEFNFLLSKNSKLKSALMYIDERIEGEDSHTIRKKGSLSLEEKISENTFLSLNSKIENAQVFNGDKQSDKDYPVHQSAYLKYTFDGVSNSYYLAFGITSIDSTSKSYKNFFWKRKINSLNSFSIEYLSDFNLDEDNIDGSDFSDNEGREYFDNDLAFYYDYSGSEWSGRLSLRYENQNYIESGVYDNQYQSFGLDIKNFIAQRLAINYYLDLSESDRSPTNNKQKDSLIGVNLIIKYNRSLTLELKGEHSQRNNSDELNFKNNSIYMIVGYSN